MMQTNLDALKEALAKMTPGKWYASGRKLYQHNGPSGPIAEVFGYQQAHDDAAGIVLLRNSADALIARIEALETELGRQSVALAQACVALRDHACHGGPSKPCIRNAHQCAADCGYKAGNALMVVEAALAADKGEK